MNKTKVYVAGLLTPRNVWSNNGAIDYLSNMRIMVSTAKSLLLEGYDPFVPAFDFLFWIVDNRQITGPMIKRYSKSWLLSCDAVFLCRGWRKSPGTLKERDLAIKNGIPVFDTWEDINEHFKRK